MYSICVSNSLANAEFVYFASASLLCVPLHHGLEPVVDSLEHSLTGRSVLSSRKRVLCNGLAVRGNREIEIEQIGGCKIDCQI